MKKASSSKKKILIGFDGSASAKKALEDLDRAGLPAECEVLLLSAVEPWTRYPSPDGLDGMGWPSPTLLAQYEKQLEGLLAAARKDAVAAAASLAASHPGWKVRAEAVADAPAAALLGKASAWKADLVVVGARGLTPIAKFLLGSVSEKVLHGRPGGIRITRARLRRSGRPVKLMIGVDGSDGAAKAIRAVAARKWPAGTQVRVVGVLEPLEAEGLFALGAGSVPAGLDADRRGKAAATRIVEAAARVLEKAGLEAEAVLVTGDSRKALVEEARRCGAECLFLGTHGRRGSARFRLGSTSSAVAAHAGCTVEIVDPG